MKVVVFADNTLPIPVSALCEVLNRTCRTVRFNPGRHRIHFDCATLSCPETYDGFPTPLTAECDDYDLAIIGTTIPYDNNFFFEWDRPQIIVSFSGWNHLTDLPIANGLSYFIASILGDCIELGQSHEESTGCVNDFWWDKTGINFGMRAAYVCADCASSFRPKDKEQEQVRTDISAILDLVSSASRAGHDVTQLPLPPTHAGGPIFDVFLCHNSVDKPSVRKVNEAMKQAGVVTWLDEEQLSPGVVWQTELEKQIQNVRSAAVFVGASGFGPWQSVEARAFLSEFVQRQCPVIPVVLKDAPSVPELPLFLKQFTWVDLRKNYSKSILRLIGGVKRR